MRWRGLVAAILFGIAAPMAGQAEGQAAESRIYKSVGGRDLVVHLYRPAPGGRAAPAVLLFHGGGWVAGDPGWVEAAGRLFQARGLVAIPVEYRLAGETTTPADALSDACDAFAWVRAHADGLGVDPGRVGAYGVSAGGQLVAAAATGACPEGARGPDLMMLWSPAIEVNEDGWFRRLMKGADPAPFSPLVRVREHRPPPTAIVQGAGDTLTPLRHVEAFCAEARSGGSPCELHVYPGLGHLLTRNLANQEDDFDPDPAARRDGQAKLLAFLEARGWIGP